MRYLTRWFPLLILAAAVIAYANSFTGPFIFDDSRVVINNPNIYTLWPPWKAVWAPTRWVADISFAVNYALSGMTPADFRMTNVGIHVLAAWLLYGIVRRTLVRPRFRERFGAAADPLAFVVALLWVAHPLQTESVTYIAQRIEALMSLFALLVLYSFIRGLDSTRPRLWMNGALAACITGMGTKEIMVTVPVLVLLYDAWAGAGSWREAVHQRWKVHLALFLSVGVFVMLFVMFSAATMATGGLVEKGINPWSYALTQTEVILHYFRLCVLPTSLCLMYRWPFAQSLAEVWPAALALAAVLGLTVWGLVRRAAFAFPLAAVFVILAPTSSIMPLSDAAFEHRMYLPLAGVLALLTVGAYALVDRTVRRWPEQTTRLPVLSLLLALTAAAWFLSLTRSRNLDYRSEGAIWEDVMKKRPDNHKVRVAMSGALMGSGRLEEAADVLTNLIARLPDFSKMPFDEIRRRYEANPTLPVIEYAMAQNNLGALYLLLSQPDTAEPRFREAIRVFPANHIGYFNMGRIAIGRGQTNDAIGWWKIALLKNKDDVGSMCFLATARAAMDRYADAAAYYDRALRVQPENPFARSQLAWILATCPEPAVRNGPRAVQLARILPGLSGDASVRAYDILGAALAEAGQFDEAVSQAEKALALRRSQLPASAAADPYADEVSRRLSLYRRHQPYREPHPASP